jgi:methyl-accepting chemotaxis protein
MSLRARIWMLPGIAAAIFLVSGIVIAVISARADRSITSVGRDGYPFVDETTRFAAQLETLQGLIASAVSEGEKSRLVTADEAAAAIRKILAEMQEHEDHRAEGHELSIEFDAYYAAAMTTARIFLGISKGDGSEAAGRMQQLQQKLHETSDRLQSDAKAGFERYLTSAREGVRSAVWAMAAAAVIVATILGVGSYLLVRSIWKQIGGEPEYARTVLRALAQGNLAQTIDVAPRAETSVLAAVREMAQGLTTLIANVRGGTETITTASAQIAAGNQDLSSRTEEQASSLQETAASMEQLTATVKQSADNAKQANQLAGAASTAATKGGEVMGQVVTKMEGIAAASKRMAEIINVIDGIAFQTNILALNAAVEAARAGEQGRGFAVVAGEVRNLAQRSAQAAREIKDMISDSAEKVDAGGRLIGAAGSSMNEIVTQVKMVTDLIAEITSAAKEQSSGIEQVNEAITQMDQVTQQNAALVEESAAAATCLREQAVKLTETVSIFKLEHGTVAPDSASAQASAAQPAIDRRASRRAKVEALPGSGTSARAREEKSARDPATEMSGTELDWAEF